MNSKNTDYNHKLGKHYNNSMYQRYFVFFLIPVLLFLTNTAFSAINIYTDVSPKNPAPGDFVMVKIIVTNTSNATTGSIRVDLPFPSNLNDLSDNALSLGGDCTYITSTSYCDSGETVQWSVGSLSSYQSVTLFMPPVISAGVADGTVISFNSQAFENNVLQASSNQSVEVKSSKVLTLAINPNKHPVEPNSQLIYSLTYGHVGTIAALGTEVRFPLPAKVSFVSADNNGSLNGGDIVWDIGSLFPGKGGKLNVTVQLESGTSIGDILVGNAIITGVADFVNEQAVANTATWVGNTIGLNFSMLTNPSTAVTGELLPTQLIVSNPTNTDRTGVRLELFFAGGLQGFLKQALLSGGDCTYIFSSSYCDNGETIFWEVGSLKAGSSRSIFIVPKLAQNTSGEIVSFDARAFADGNSVIWQSNSVLVQSERALNLALESNHYQIPSNSQVTYYLTYGNQGPAATTNTQLEFIIPDGMSFISASDNTIPSGNKVIWNLGLVNPEDGGKKKVSLSLNSGLQAGILFAGYASINGTANSQVEKVFAGDVNAVGHSTKLGFSMQVNPNSAVTGGLLPTQFIITNKTNTLQTNVKVEYLFENGLLDFNVSALLNNGNCTYLTSSSFCDSGEAIVWDIGNLGPNNSKTLFVAPIISSTMSGDLIPFISKVSSNGLADKWAKQTIRVQRARTLDISIDANHYPIMPSGEIIYDITFGHQGATSTTNTQLKFTLPKDTLLVSASGNYASTDNGNALVWDLGTLNTGDGGKRQVTLQMGSTIIAGDIVNLEPVTISGMANTQAEYAEANTAVWIGNESQLDYSMTVNPNPAVSGEFLPTQLTISNKSNVVLTGVRAEFYLSEHLNNLSINALNLDAGVCTYITNSSICNNGETAFWEIGTLPPNGGKTISIAPLIDSTTASGNIIRVNSRVFANGTSHLLQQTTILVKDDLTLNLTIDSLQEPVISEQNLTYDLSFGNRGSVATTNTTLLMPVPNDTSFVSADADGSLNGTNVLWDIGTLNPGEGSRRQAVFQINNNVAIGEIIETNPVVKADNDEQAWASSKQRVRASSDLTLFLDLNPINLTQNDVFDADLTIENNSVGTMTGIDLNMYYPNYLKDYNDNLFSDGGDCLSIWGSSGYCDSGETAFWSLGNMLANDSKTISMSPVIDDTTNPPPNGTVVQFFGRANNAALDEAFTSRSLLVGSFIPSTQPEMDIFGSGNEIIDGDTTPSTGDNTLFGAVLINSSPMNRMFVIQNNGTNILNLTGSPRVQISGVNAGDFSISSQPSGTVAVANSTSFIISFNPSTNGVKFADITIANDDSDENPYTFRVSGTAFSDENIFGDGFE